MVVSDPQRPPAVHLTLATDDASPPCNANAQVPPA